MLWLLLLALPPIGLALCPGISPSRRLLAGVLTVLVPGAGLVLAALVVRTRGGAIAAEPEPELPPQVSCPEDIRAFAEQPAIVDRLLLGDPDQRLAALVALSTGDEAQAIAILRWVVDHAANDAVLEAAITLEEIELRGDSPVGSRVVSEPRRARATTQVRDVAAAALLS